MTAFLAAVLLPLAVLAACSDEKDSGTEPPEHAHAVASLIVNPDAASLKAGDVFALQGVARCGCGDVLSPAITWTTSDPMVATVAATGEVTALAFGAATITATAEAVSATAMIQVNPTGTVIGTAGGTVTSADGNVTLEIPAGALETSVDVVIEPSTDPQVLADPLYVAGTAYVLEPETLQLRERTRLRIRFDPDRVPPGIFHEQLRLRERERQQQQWRETEQNRLQQHVMEAEIERFGLFAIVIQPAVGTMVGPLGGVVNSADGKLELTVPAGALAAPVDIVVAPLADAQFAGDPYYVAGTAWSIEPDGCQLQVRARLRIRFDPASVPAGINHDRLRIQERDRDQDRWREQQHTQLQQHVVQAEIEALGEFAIVAAGASGQLLEPAAVTVSPTIPSVEVGDAIQLTAVVTDANGDVLNVAVAWTSSAPAIADVDDNGLVTGKAPGTAIITASVGDVEAQVGVTVKAQGPAPASITVTPAAATLAVGQTVQLAAEVLDSNGDVMNVTPTWSSSNTAVATVSDGLVTAVAPGQSTISAKYRSVTGFATITVSPAAASIVIDDPGKEPIEIGLTRQLTATVYDASGTPVQVQIDWSSGDENIATVDQTGLVTGVGAGKVWITAEALGASDSVEIRVVGESEGLGNNLSWPLVFADGVGLTGLPPATETGLRPTAAEGITVTQLPFFWSGNLPTYGIYHEQQTFNTWQAEWIDGAGQGPYNAEIAWGDNLMSRTWSASRPIRIEHALYATGLTLTGFNMTYLYGDGPSEMQGTDGSTDTFTPGIYTANPGLLIERLDQEGGTPIDTVESSIAGSEVNVSGKVIYGYLLWLKNWTPPSGMTIEGWYRITFELASGANVVITSLANAGGVYVPHFTATKSWLDIYIDP